MMLCASRCGWGGGGRGGREGGVDLSNVAGGERGKERDWFGICDEQGKVPVNKRADIHTAMDDGRDFLIDRRRELSR